MAKTDSIRDADGVGVFCKDMITLVMMEGRTEIEPFCGLMSQDQQMDNLYDV